ncbi:putative transposase [Phyllobacterium brassicacearum]|nr:putative transposase [Phyllobacterium brassicacearum]
MNMPVVRYKRHRFPPQIIAHAVWLYFRFPLSLQLVEEMLPERGIVVSYETIRRWAWKFGPKYARRLLRKQPRRDDIWHLDEVVIISIAGRKHGLWRAVDQDGYVLDELVQNRRNTKAAKRLLTRLLRKQGLVPKRMITDKLRSYGAAKRQVMPGVEHRSHKGLNNRAENSHVPLRKRERMMQGFRSPGVAATLRRDLLRHQKSLRPTPLQTFGKCNPPSPPQGNGAVECCNRRAPA